MKKLLALLLSVMLVAAFSFAAVSCGENGGGSEGDKTYDGTLKVGMECGYQPFNWTQFDSSNGAVAISGKTGQYANGYDVIIAKKIAEALNYKLEIYAYDWESLIPAVQSGALDFIIAGMSPTAERKEIIDFSVNYYESNLVIVVRKDGAYANATSIVDFSGAKIVAQSGTFHDDVIDQIQGVLHQTAMEDFPTMITALKSNSISGYIAEEPGAIADCNANSEFKYIPLVNNGTGFTIEDMSDVSLAVGLKKNSELLEKVNETLNGISASQKIALMAQAVEWAAQLGE